MKRSGLFLLFLLATSLSLARAQDKDEGKDVDEGQAETNTTDTTDVKKEGKVFSIFNVVQFKNVNCQSQSAMTSGQSSLRNGTCFTNSECSTKGGTASGNCASGFGVCCLFLVSSSGSTFSQNSTYLRNPSFPAVYSATSSLTYTVNKCSNDVCWLRLDFETFNILGAATTTEPTSGACVDTFAITSPTTPATLLKPICGSNAGQHIYVDMGNQATDSVTLAFTFTGTSTLRTWEIKINQLTCSNLNRPPSGCLQYHTTLVGRIKTFNFNSVTSSHLASMDQNVCIRQAAGYCCIEYQLCTDQLNPFTLDRSIAFAAATAGQVDSSCILDYVAIPGSVVGQCNNRASSQFTRYCGAYLGLTILGNVQEPICDCTAPYVVNFHTDATADGDAANAPASRGICLDYMQVPCNN